MNKLSRKRRAEIVAALVEGTSINSAVRITGVSKPTIPSCWPISARHARNIKMKSSAVCHAKESNVTKSGVSALPRIKTSPMN